MITVHRETKDTNEAQIIFGKIKPRSVGITGQISLNLDLQNFVYYEHTEQGQRRYAQAKESNDVKDEPTLTDISKMVDPDFDNSFNPF